MENQGPSIYFPTGIDVLVSNDGVTYQEAGTIKRPYADNSQAVLKDFKINFPERKARYVKVKASHLKESKNSGGVGCL